MEHEEHPPEELISKTRRKRTAHALQELGEALVGLNESQLAQLELPEQLHDAVLLAKRISKFGALRRQVQYIGRLMREVDAAAIAAQLEAWKGQSRQAVAYLHQVERWRTRLLDSDAALSEFLSRHPGCDVQRLRQLVREARKEQADQAAPRSYRELFQTLKAAIPEPPASAAGHDAGPSDTDHEPSS
jgi:ribosome-associated protein